MSFAPENFWANNWEGVFGGLLFAGLFALCDSAWFHQPVLAFVPRCLAAVAFSDRGAILTELKRFAGRTAAHCCPGTGGNHDRIDSITAAAPVLYFGMTRLGCSS